MNFVAQRIDDGSQNKKIYECDTTQQFDFAKKSYEKGVELIKFKNYSGAFKMLRQAATLTMFNQDMPDAKDLQIRSLSNLTLCQKNLNNHQYTVDVKLVLEMIMK